MTLPLSKRPGTTPALLVDGVTFNASTTSGSSASYDAMEWEHFTLWIQLLKEGGTSHGLSLDVECSPDGEDWYLFRGGLSAQVDQLPLTYTAADIGSGLNECYVGTCPGRYMRITATATGTSAENRIRLSCLADFWH
ncbi:MAG TPA: hypothetical protein VMV78_08790 [Thiobacillus sp.]|nr:hypothetical protein [Thiobacillus sp.]